VLYYVVAAIIRREGRILITRRFDNVHLPGLWEFPGGKVESGETLQQALIREIREELGVEISVEEERFTIEHHYPTKSVELHFFNCSIVSGEPRIIAVADLRWATPAELSQYQFPEADRELIAILSSS
jgi:mutator protein MutT